MEENTRGPQKSSRLGLRNRTGCNKVEVQGCHIVRATGRKDRHSKVCTSKGPRDRRVRLAAHTAIQFYDVQDRLGYDRPSKAVDWLIKKAKLAIDELEQRPARNPAKFSAENAIFEQEQARVGDPNTAGCSSKRAMTTLGNENGLQILHQSSNADPNATFLPPSLDSDSIAYTINSFFPTCTSNSINSGQTQDLRLSLQSFQDPLILHHHHHKSEPPPPPAHHKNTTHCTEEAYSQHQVPFNGTTFMGFDGGYAGWSEVSRFQGLAPWTNGVDTSGGNGEAAGYPLASQPVLQQLLCQSQFFSQGRPLQSNNTPSVRAWMDHSTTANTTLDHSHRHHHNPTAVPIYPSSISGVEFTSIVGGFSGFDIPQRIRGDEEEHDGYTPSYASSDSHH